MSTRSKVLFGVMALGALAFAARRLTPIHITNSPPPEGPIIAFGDSLTQGVGAGAGTTYPEHLSRLLGRDVINRGVAGETASQALARLDRDVLSANPGVVLICLGGNDLLQQRDPEATFGALDRIVTRVVDRGAMVVLIGVEGLPLLSHDFGERFEDLAERTGCLYVPDILDGIMSRGELMSDTLHPNGEGYAVFAERVAKALQPHLE